MYLGKIGQILAVALVLVIPTVFAQTNGNPIQSDWMELVKGHLDTDTGIQLVNIEDGDTAGSQTITLAVPKDSIGNRNAIEEVLVVGQMLEPPAPSEPLDITYEWVDDYDNENYGLIIRLGKDTNWPIRLYMNSGPGFIE